MTSWLFPDATLDMERLARISSLAGKKRLVIDLSCRRRAAADGSTGEKADGWYVATNRWQTVTGTRIEARLLERLAEYCDEFLIHAADVEGRQQGMDWDLVALLARISPIPTTYAGGAKDLSDLDRLHADGSGRLDLSIGSALDIFGGKLVRYADCAAWNRAHRPHKV